MGVTAVKRVENRSRGPVSLHNIENPGTRGNGTAIAPGEGLAVDMWIPWAPNWWDFPGKRLELRLAGQPRWSIWQAAKGDGDFVRYATDLAWHDPGERVFGVPAVDGDRALVVLDDFFTLVPVYPAGSLPPYLTTIKRVDNRTTSTVSLRNVENPSANVTIGPMQSRPATIVVPWAGQAQDFEGHHLQIQRDGVTRHWLWQAASTDGDFVRVSTDGRWRDGGQRVDGVAGASGDRTLVIVPDGVELVAQTAFGLGIGDLQQLGSMGDHRLCPVQPPDPRPARRPSEPKKAAVAFSVAGPATDAYDRGDPNARFLYRDSGKRYEFEIQNGVVVATHPDGRQTRLTEAVSFQTRRAGETVPAPAMDLVAAGNGRVFAKAADRDEVYFATLDEIFVAARPDGRPLAVPSTYFTLDPQFNQPDGRDWDLTAHLAGCYGDHPAAERFPHLFWPLLEQDVMDGMVVRLDRGKWHRLDPRPPFSRLQIPLVLAELARRFLPLYPPALLNPITVQAFSAAIDLVKAVVERLGDQTGDVAPPAWTPPLPTFAQVTHCKTDILGPREIPLLAVRYERVLDIGVGHVHWCEQYQPIFGGEMQPLRAGRLLGDPFPPVTYADLYQIFNGPIRDGDGFVDGTCNYYLMVQLRPDPAPVAPTAAVKNPQQPPDTYAILYHDEQFYFTQRWRLVHPDDFKGPMFALVKDLDEDTRRGGPLYHWRPATYWCPFRAGQVGPRSRMAVAAQVVLITGGDPPDGGQPLLFSINFSYATMDRTWRWRALPAPVRYFETPTAAWDEAIAGDQAPRVYPETVRLREDTTIHLKGARGAGEVGRWYQRYLPAGNVMTPAIGEVAAGQRPPRGYGHRWKFLPEPAFRRADRFSHFGVYDTVDSRSRYYPVTPASEADAAKLAAAPGGEWRDEGRQLAVDAWRFPWHGGLLGYHPRRPPSLHEPVMRLRIVRRGGRGWVALHRDKRDDDLHPFAGLPQTVMLTNGATSVKVTIGPSVAIEAPPAVRRAHFWWEGSGPTRRAAVAFSSPIAPSGRELERVWRVRMAALEPATGDPTRVGRVVSLLDVETEGRFVRGEVGNYEYRWTPNAADQANLDRYCSPTGEAAYATSIWFDDVAGHVGVPDELRWAPPPTMRVTTLPQRVPLGVPVQVTIQAVDVHTGAPVAGTVSVDDRAVGSTNVPFTWTFTSRWEEEFDPETRVKIRYQVFPTGRVAAPDYPEAAIPFEFFTPVLRRWVEPASIPLGPPVQVTVRAEDNDSRVPVAGRVTIGGRDVGATNAPFTHAFTAMPTTGTISAPGYPATNVSFLLYAPRLGVWVQPSPIVHGRPVQVTVRAEDTTTRAPVAGRVRINGQDVGATNAPFAYTFGASPPAGVVAAPYYPEAAIPWPPLRPPGLEATIQPHPVQLGVAATYTVRAVDDTTRSPVAGTVTVNGAAVAQTNVPFSYTFRVVRRRVRDSETGVYLYEEEYPVAAVAAPGYPTVDLDLGI